MKRNTGMFTGKVKRNSLGAWWVLLSLIFLLPAHGYPPTIILGLYGERLILSEPDESVTNTRASGTLGWRSGFPTGGYFALTSSALLNRYLNENGDFFDAENLTAELALPVGKGGEDRLSLEATLNSSLLGTATSPGFLSVEWATTYRRQGSRRGLRPEVSYLGSYFLQDDGVEDTLYQGMRFGFTLSPTVRLELGTFLEAGWEYWPEYPIYDSAGGVTSARRNDALLTLDTEVSGLAGYFLSWSLLSGTGLRYSNANRYLSVSGLQENSESNWFLTAQGELEWSPSLNLNLRLGSFVRHELYFQRTTLAEEGLSSGTKLQVLSLGSSFRSDLMLGHHLYLVGEASGAKRFSNDPTEERWHISISAGLEYSF